MKLDVTIIIFAQMNLGLVMEATSVSFFCLLYGSLYDSQ
jgi:hypothetical protein